MRSLAFSSVVLGVTALFHVLAGAMPASLVAAAQAPDLVAAFARAADAIRRHQSAEGYWSTPVTLGPTFEGATAEVNVFTPAMIIDLLDPVAAETGLADALARGRAYLRRQIEPTGLVRYHGDPGPVPPEVRGCELPPDADDTALVWRIAPGSDRERLAAARREIERYRDADGLYRTWLADEAAYRCFYVRYAGRQWNPADVAVEMHVYLFLAGYDGAAAARLCDALRRRMDDDGIWVWYTVAPLVPVLRELDLARNGCALRVPDARIGRARPGQDRYVIQARLLRSLLTEGPGAPAPYLQALRAGAAGDFAGLIQAPPLIYHNNLSATPPHYHWSEDVGFALWLRLYVETARRFPGALALPAPKTGHRGIGVRTSSWSSAGPAPVGVTSTLTG